jgi:uncharacterized protein (DUF3820 family)
MKLNDLSPMPFGKHKGVPMQDVPASYLFWLWSNGKEHDKLCPVAEYIRSNLDALEMEYPDGVWKTKP